MPTGSLRVDQGATVALAWLSQPITVLALVVLVVNDHVLKAAYPGLVTGKLSDLAGLVLAPPLLAVAATLLLPLLSARTAAIFGVTGTGLGFVVVKGSAAGAASASAVWSAVSFPSVIRADTTDLLTLPALALAWWIWTRARRRPVAHRLVRLTRILVVLPAAVLAVAATSYSYPQAVAIAQWRGAIVVGEINAAAAHFDDALQWRWARISEDSGQTWRWLDDDELQTVTAEVDRADAEPVEACVPDDPAVCYRVVPGHLRVEETRDGGATWATSWEVDDEARDRLAQHFWGLGDPARNLSSHALLVHPTAGGHVVLVANGRDGYALRDEDGQWRRIGFGMGDDHPNLGDPVPMPGTWAPMGFLWGQVAAVAAGLVVMEVARRHGRHRWLHLPGLAILVLGLAAQFTTNAHAALPGPAASFGYYFAVGLTMLGLAVWLAPLAATRVLSARQWNIALLAIALGGLVVSLVIGSAARPAAIAAAALLWGAITAVTATAARRIRRGGPGENAWVRHRDPGSRP